MVCCFRVDSTCRDSCASASIDSRAHPGLPRVLRLEAVDGPDPSAAVQLAELFARAGEAVDADRPGVLVLVSKHECGNEHREDDSAGKVLCCLG